MGTKQPSIARIESGTINIRIETLTKLAEALNATIRIDLAPAECLAHSLRQRAWWDEPATLLRLEPVKGTDADNWTVLHSEQWNTEIMTSGRRFVPIGAGAEEVRLLVQQLELQSEAVIGKLVG